MAAYRRQRPNRRSCSCSTLRSDGRSGVSSELGLRVVDRSEVALGSLVGELNRIIAVRLYGDDGNVLPRNNASETQAGLEILELRHGDSAADRTGFGLTADPGSVSTRARMRESAWSGTLAAFLALPLPERPRAGAGEPPKARTERNNRVHTASKTPRRGRGWGVPSQNPGRSWTSPGWAVPGSNRRPPADRDRSGGRERYMPPQCARD